MLKLNTLSGFGSGVSGGGAFPPTYGYTAGGNTGGAVTAACDRITFSTSVNAAHTDGDLDAGSSGGVGHSDNVTYGYHSGGTTGAQDKLTNRMTLATSVMAAHTDSDMTANKKEGWGLSTIKGGGTYGYAVGGE
jgi:hypothetical protein